MSTHYCQPRQKREFDEASSQRLLVEYTEAGHWNSWGTAVFRATQDFRRSSRRRWRWRNVVFSALRRRHPKTTAVSPTCAFSPKQPPPNGPPLSPLITPPPQVAVPPGNIDHPTTPSDLPAQDTGSRPNQVGWGTHTRSGAEISTLAVSLCTCTC